MPAARWQRYRILEGSKGPLVAEFATVRAVQARDGLPGPEGWLVVRRTLPTAEEEPVYKYYLSNAPAETPPAALVRVSGLRWPIETCFTEGKGEVGLDHYEVRTWRGWHHHMTLVILAHYFLMRLAAAAQPERGGPATRRRRRRRTRWSGWAGAPVRAARLPPRAVRVSLAEARLLLRALLPLPVLGRGGGAGAGWPTSSGARRPPTAPIASGACWRFRPSAHDVSLSY